MERFDIFKGLLGLRAINLVKKANRSGKMEPIVFEFSSSGSSNHPSKSSDIPHGSNNHIPIPSLPVGSLNQNITTF